MRTAPRHEDPFALLHEDQPARPRVQHRLLRDEDAPGPPPRGGRRPPACRAAGARPGFATSSRTLSVRVAASKRGGTALTTAANLRPAPGCVTIARVPSLKNSPGPSNASASTLTSSRSASGEEVFPVSSKGLSERDVSRDDEPFTRGADLDEVGGLAGPRHLLDLLHGHAEVHEQLTGDVHVPRVRPSWPAPCMLSYGFEPPFWIVWYVSYMRRKFCWGTRVSVV